jgi:hypothetical protein
MRIGIHVETSYQTGAPKSWCWQAWERDYDDGACIGYGRTEAEAVADLLFEMEERATCPDWHVVLSVSETVSEF